MIKTFPKYLGEVFLYGLGKFITTKIRPIF